MLNVLRIKNLALVPDLTLELRPGYNVITGETGAGKSMLIGALDLVLGERAEKSLIRGGCDSCTVEAVFDTSRLAFALETFLEQNGLEPCEDHQLVLKRVCTISGSNRQFVNGSPTTLNTLSAIGQWLADIHGAHEHQSLLHPARQLALLDAFGALDAGRERFAATLQEHTTLLGRKAELIIDEKTYAQQLDLLRFQSQEIAKAGLNPGEDEQLEADYKRASNAARLAELCRAAVELLSDSENSLLSQAGLLGRTLSDLQRTDSSAAPLSEMHAQAVEILNELHSAISHYADKVDLDPERFQALEERLNLVQSLKRKYGNSAEEILEHGKEAARKLSALESRDAELAQLNKHINKVTTELWKKGAELSAARKKVAPGLCKSVARQLADLGFAKSRLEIDFKTVSEQQFRADPGRALRTGLDAIEFQFAPNPGEPLRSLRAIASSGELARVMLAFKTVLAAQDQVPVLVFDEVDANVGGETARAVGQKLRQLASKRQVLSITHMPQVAATADAHYVVTKQVQDGRTVSSIKLLQPHERVTEIARMLGGQTEAARKHAQSLLSEA